MGWFKLWTSSSTYLDTRENGVNVHGWVVSAHGAFSAPEADVEEIAVPGRNGTVLIPNNRFTNVERTFSVFVGKDFTDAWNTAKNILGACANSYYMLEDSTNPGHFYMARVKSLGVISTGPYFKSGVFEVVFDCQPQRWRIDGAQWYTYTGPVTSNLVEFISAKEVSVDNVTDYTAPMAIRINGYGTIRYPYGYNLNYVVQVAVSAYSTAKGSLVLDAQLNDMYFTNSSDSPWPYVQFSVGALANSRWPLMPPSGMHIYGTGDNLTSIDVMPRWWQM